MRDGGIVKLYTLQDTAEAGAMPALKLVYASESYFSFKTASVTRRYAALGANRDFSLLIRCHNIVSLPEGTEYAVLEDGSQYRIDIADPIFDDDAMDLTLVRLGTLYDVASE